MPPSEQVNLCFTAPFYGERIRKKSFCMFIVSPVTPLQALAIPHSVQLIPRSHHPPRITPICSHSCCWSWEHPYLNLVTLWTCPCASSQQYPWAHPAAPAHPAYIAAIPPCPRLHLLCHTKSHALPSPPVFISVHGRWPSLRACFCICLCSDHRQTEEDMTNINLQLLKWAVPTRLCRERWFWRPLCHLSQKPPKGDTQSRESFAEAMLQERGGGCWAFVKMWKLSCPLPYWRCWARYCVWSHRD